VHLGRAFVGASAAIVGTVLLCNAALLSALHDLELGAGYDDSNPVRRRARATPSAAGARRRSRPGRA
jgi:hypothetical protein